MGVTCDCLQLVGEVPVVKESLTMVQMIGKMVMKRVLEEKLGWDQDHLLIRRGMKDIGNCINICRMEKLEDCVIVGSVEVV